MTQPRANADERRPMHRDLLGMLAVWVFSVPALILSVLLTLLKYRSDHLCDSGLLSSCHRGWFTCATIFQDRWSTVAGLPLTVYAAAFYFVIAALAGLALCMPRRVRMVARTAVLVFAWGGVAVTLVLAAYAVLRLRAVCLYCGYFYGVNVAVLLAARMMHPRGTAAGLRPLVRAPEAAVVFAVSVLGFVTALLLQRALYLRAVSDIDPYALRPCVTRLGKLEPSEITVAGPGAPRAVVKLFVDLDCPLCRDELKMWREVIAEKPYELRVYHHPLSACDLGGIDSSPSCNAARALLCLTDALGDGAAALARLERMFQLQDSSGPHFSHQDLATVAREYGFAADPTRAAAADPFFRCMQSPETTATLQRHIRLAREVGGLRSVPGALIVPLVDGQPRGEGWRIVGRKPRALLVEQIDQKIAETELTAS